VSNKSGVSSQIISLPQGGGALHGIREKCSPDLHTGIRNFAVPIALSPGRNGFQPQIWYLSQAATLAARSIARAPKVPLRALNMFMTARGFLGSSQQERRLRQMDTRTGQLWHASLGNLHTGERNGFADLQSLFAFLEEQTNDSDRRSNVDAT
jgi:hypothetical protein